MTNDPAVSAITPTGFLREFRRQWHLDGQHGGDMTECIDSSCLSLFAAEGALRAALLSSDRAVHWRPIQTAPKDRRIVVWLDTQRKAIVCWREKAERWHEDGMGFCDPLCWFDVPMPEFDDAGETHDTVLS